MATYSDGTTEAMVGDVVETKDQSALLPTGCYRVVLVNGPFHVKLGAITASEHLNTDCGIWLSDRFTLIQRDGNFISRKQEPPMSEPLPGLVNHPPHYAGLSPEPVDVIEAWQLEWHEGNAMKYIARAKNKGERVQDLRKAAWYLTRKADMLEKQVI